MTKKLSIPQFQLQSIYADGSRDEPELHTLNDIDSTCRMGRRGFLLTSAIGVGALAALTLAGDAEAKRNNAPVADKAPPIPKVQATNISEIAAHSKPVNTLAFSPDGKLLISGSRDNTIKYWSMPNGKLLKTLTRQRGSVDSLAFSPDSKIFASCSEDGLIRLSTTFSGETHKTIPIKVTPNVHAGSVTFSPDGTLLVSDAPLNSEPSRNCIRFWDVSSGVIRATLEHDGRVLYYALSADGKMLAGSYMGDAGKKDSIVLWSLPSGKKIAQWECTTSGLSFSPDGTILASGKNGSGVTLWGIPSGERLSAKPLIPSAVRASKLAFSPDGSYLAVIGEPNRITLLGRPFDKPSLLLTATNANFNAIAFSKDSRFLAAGGLLGSIHIWELPYQGKESSFHTSLFDPEATGTGISVAQCTLEDKTVQVVSCGTPLPSGATCTCNCVSGKYTKPAPSSPAGSGGGGGRSICTCNKVCICIPT